MESSTAAPNQPLRRRSAREIGNMFVLGRKAKRLLSDGQSPADFLKLLIENHCYPDVVRFMAYSVPSRQSVWWACLTARHVVDPANRNDMNALQAALHWVIEPTSAARSAAKAAAENATPKSPAAYVAKAASVAAIEKEDFRGPGDVLAARLAGAAILASVALAPEKPVRRRYRQFVAIGLDVSIGALKWDAARK